MPIPQIPPNRWTALSHRRLQAHPSPLTSNNTLLAAPLPQWLAQPIIPRFEQLGVFTGTAHAVPNHVLVNEYRPGEGIMPHEDGGAYSAVVATVSLGAPIVLEVVAKRRDGEEDAAASTRNDRHEVNGENAHSAEADDAQEPSAQATPLSKTRILQEPRSLLVTTGPAYSELLHGIAPELVDEDLRPATIANWALLGDAGQFAASGRCERGVRVSLTYRDVLKVSKVGMKVLGLGRK